MNKEKIEAIIDRLADKTLSFGLTLSYPGNTKEGENLVYICEEHSVNPDYENSVKAYSLDKNKVVSGNTWGINNQNILGHPIHKGAVAKKIALQYMRDEFPDNSILQAGDYEHSRACELLALWSECEGDDEELSLQEIIEDSGWDSGEIVKIKNGLWEVQRHGKCLSSHSLRGGAEQMPQKLKDNGQLYLASPTARDLFELIDKVLPPNRPSGEGNNP